MSNTVDNQTELTGDDLNTTIDDLLVVDADGGTGGVPKTKKIKGREITKRIATGSTEARYLEDRLAEWVNVKDFGAKGDGSTDDTAAIQAAIDSITEGVVHFPAGDYKVTDDITVDKHNITLMGENTATLVVPSTTTTTSGYVLDMYAAGDSQPINCHLVNINVDIYTNSGGNNGGIRWGGSYGSMKDVNIRVHGDNMTGLAIANNAHATGSGAGPYYNHFEQVFVQGDSDSGTPLTSTIGVDLVASTLTVSRCPNANTFTCCRVSKVHEGYYIRGHGNTFTGCVSESITNRHYYAQHASVSSGASRCLILNPYCEHYSGSTVLECGTNASGIVLVQPYYTAVTAVFTDNSTAGNCRLVDTDNIADPAAHTVRASVKATGTTVNHGFNVASVSKIGTGIFRVNFTDALADTNFIAVANCTSNDLTCRVSTYNTGYVQLYFFDVAGTATDPTGFNALIFK